MNAAYVAVETSIGPHVTPQAFAIALGDAWLVAAEDTAKVRAIRRRPRVALLFPDGDQSLLVEGRAKVLTNLQVASLGPALGVIASEYAVRNGGLLTGMATDVALGASGLPLGRVLIRVSPSRRRRMDGAPEGITLDVVAPATAELGPCEEAVLALSTPAGPVVVPAAWDEVNQEASVSPAALAELDVAPRTSGCLTLASSPDCRPSGFSGQLVRGDVVLDGQHPRLAARRVTWWEGFESGSTSYP